MKSKMLIGASLIALAGFSVRAFAGSPGVPRQPLAAEQKAATLAELEQARATDERFRQLGQLHGIWLSRDIDKQAELDRLIQRVQNGEAVNPDEVDRAIQR